MSQGNQSVKQVILSAFEKEFVQIRDKFEIIELLGEDSPMDYETIKYLKLPSENNNIVWHPGVYMFIGNNQLYRVGVSMINSRQRVMKHLEVRTQKGGFCIWDIDNYDDKSIVLFNVKDKADKFWLLALEAFIEIKFKPNIKAGRIG